ncbi:MAG TPA: O-antigen ligase family protein [Gemmatimonadaceae bacterium]
MSARSVALLGAIGLALANVGRIPAGALGGRTAPFTLADLALLAAWLCVARVALTRRPLELPRVAMATLAFAAVAALSTAFAIPRYHMGGGEALGAAAFLVRWVAYFGWFLFGAWCLTDDESVAAWRDVERALLAFAAFGVLQSLLLPGFAQMIHPEATGLAWDIQGRRLVSTVLDPNFAGALVVMALLHRLARVAEGMRESVPAIGTLFVAVLLTVSRSSVLALGVGVLVILAVRGLRIPLLRLIAAGILVVLPFATLLLGLAAEYNKLRFDASAAQRLIPWSRAVALVIEHPALGVGFNAVAQAQREHGWVPVGGAGVSFDGGLLFVAAMTGLVGLAAYLQILRVVWSSARRTWRDPVNVPADRAHAVATAACIAAIVVHSLFVNSLLLPFVMQVLWLMWSRLARIRAAAWRAASSPIRRPLPLVAAALPFLVLLGGCEPCSGTAACTTPPRLAYTGTILDPATGRPASGVRVELSVNGAAPVSTTTDGGGNWALELAAPDSATASPAITVTAPGAAEGYTVRDLPVKPVTRRGDAVVLGQWTSVPYVVYQATLNYKGKPVKGATVTFLPRSGSATVVTDGSLTNASGIFEIRLVGTQLGNVVGDLQISGGGLPRGYLLAGLTVPLEYRYTLPAPRGTLNLGSTMRYAGQVYDRALVGGVAGATVTFRRTGGIVISPSTITTTSGASGYFTLETQPASEGVVTGTLTIQPLGKPAFTRQVQMATYDSTDVRFLGVFAFGQQWKWAVELWRRDSLIPARNVQATFTRTGGLGITPSSITGTTGPDGRLTLIAIVQDSGEVIGDVTVTAPGKKPYTITGLHLPTFNDDALHFAGVYTFGYALRYALELWRFDSLKVAPNMPVLFVRTGGVAMVPDSVRAVTDANGRFNVVGSVADTGVVEGRLEVMPIPGVRYVVPNVRLRVTEDEPLHFAGVFGYGPSLRYVGEVLTDDGRPAVGATVEWTQLSGPAATPSTFTTTVRADGTFPIMLYPSAAGTVTGQVRIRPPAPWPAGTVYERTLALPTFESSELRLAVTFRIPNP